MTAFDLPETDGKPLHIVDFKVNLVSSPPEILQRSIDTVDDYIQSKSEALCINYKDALLDEGRLNIYICRFQSGKCRLHIFGKIKGEEFRTEKIITETSKNSWGILNQKINYVLKSSRHILRTYYISSNIKSIENHLMAFLVP